MAFIRLQNVRVTFLNLFEKGSYNGKETDYSATFIFNGKGPHQVEIGTATADAEGKVKLVFDKKADMNAVVRDAAVAKWGAKADAQINALRHGNFFCWKDGDAKSHVAGFAGNMTLKANNKQRPRVYNGSKQLLNEEDGTLYNGCYVNAIVEVYARDNSVGKGLSCTLHQIMFAKDGDSFVGSRLESDTLFDDVTAGVEASDFV